MDAPALYDLSPLLRLALFGAVLALGPLAWVWLRHRRASPTARLRALTLLTLFLTFDLVLFGAFTRLTDSGLGCPDWPGCYGSASPLGARDAIHAAQGAMPSGPVTHGKAWVEMVHRYLATGVGVLILVLTVASLSAAKHWRAAGDRRKSGTTSASASALPWWATVTLLWVCLQGAFGALTVTMKLYPAIVTLHLLGGLGLLALLAAQSQAYGHEPMPLSRPLYRGLIAVALLCVLQIALGGWVSTNYAVLACSEFPRCQGAWWPAMDFDHGFTVWRELGAGKDGGYLPFAALTAIHVVHRNGALVVSLAIAMLAWRLVATGRPVLRRWAAALVSVLLWQLASGLSNVVLGWPIVAALAHTGGAAALIMLLTVMLVRAHPTQARWHAPSSAQPRGASRARAAS